MARVVLSHGDILIRQGLLQLMSSDPDLRIVAEVDSAVQMIQSLRAGGVDMVVMDINIPGRNAMDSIRSIKNLAPEVAVMVLATHVHWQIAYRAIKAGANGYIAINSRPEQLLDAIRAVSAGSNVLDPALAMQIAFRGSKLDDRQHNRELSDREYQVFEAMARGRSIKSIADELHLSPKTIGTHKARILEKLELKSMNDLVRYAARHGVIQ